MSERMTGIQGPKGSGVGLEDYGRKTRPEMLATYRRYYQHQLEQAQTALALTDDQLTVTTYLGSWAGRNPQVVTE